MPCRNRGEILRLILEESQSAYELEVVGFKNWERGVKSTTPHGKLPVLRNYDGRGRNSNTVDFRAQNMNTANLFYSFFNQQTGEPVELEEVGTRASALPPAAPQRRGPGRRRSRSRCGAPDRTYVH